MGRNMGVEKKLVGIQGKNPLQEPVGKARFEHKFKAQKELGTTSRLPVHEHERDLPT